MAGQGRDTLINLLCFELTNRFGITSNPQMSAKLRRLFADLDTLEFRSRVTLLSSLPATHPSWIALVAKLTVHETYFFRDEKQLAMLRNSLFPHLIDKAAGNSTPCLRILSAGCSTGEEVYSLVILLLDTLLERGCAYGNCVNGVKIPPSWRVEVLGVDVSLDALAHAKNARYAEEGLGSFRDMEPRWKNWFEIAQTVSSSEEGGAGYRSPREFVRNFPRFGQHNLLQSAAHFGSFDLIICRNTMIYFNDEDKSRVQNNLLDVLNSNGALVLGATDPFLCQQRCTQHRSEGMAFYTHKLVEPRSVVPVLASTISQI